MSALNRDLVEGFKVLVDGYLPNEDGERVHVTSKGLIMEDTHIGNSYALVKIKNGPNKKEEIVKVPVNLIFYTNQKSDI